jgi:perosamine synthetase
MVVQSRHFMYSATTHAALGALLAPAGIAVGSLTTSLRQFQVQRLLSTRYADLRDLQYSCWELGLGQAACSRCPECRGIALNLIAEGVSPAEAGIDLGALLLAHADWQPGRASAPPEMDRSLPRATAGQAHAMQELRCLAATPAERVGALLDGAPPPERGRALAVYERLRASALAQDVEPEPGYRAGYLDLLPARLREGVRAILDEHFEPAAPDSYERMLANTRTLSGWLAAPLRRAGQRPPAPPTEPPLAQPPEAVTLPEGELGPLRELIPDPEPRLGSTADGRQLRVAETLLDGNELDYVTECVTGNWISSAGSFVPRLEQAFAKAMGCRHAVACTSGTAALHLALAAAGVGPGDEVIAPAFTMIATASAARYVGARAVLVDADPATWNLDPRLLGDKLSSRTRAVLPVHTYGQPADMDAIRNFAGRNGLVVIEDAAEAHGARYRGRPVGSIGDVAAFSLYGNKIVTSGEGGMVTTDDDSIAEVARELRDHAFSPERHFWHRRPGFNYRMTNLQAAVGLAQTERIEELVARREEIARAYREELEGVEGLELPPRLEGGVTWMFGVTVNEHFGIDRDELRRRLAERGMETRTFFVPLHLQPVLRERFAGERYPVAERLGRDGLYLPSGPTLSADDVAYIGEALRSSRVAALAAETPSSA